MHKLVFVHSWGDEGCCGTSHIAFEYESKDKFCYDALEILEKWKKENKLIGRKIIIKSIIGQLSICLMIISPHMKLKI